MSLWIRWEHINEKSMNHLKTGKCDYSSWGGSDQVSCTPTIKTRNALLLKNFLNAVNYTRVPLVRVVTLFLKPWTHNLHHKVELINLIKKSFLFLGWLSDKRRGFTSKNEAEKTHNLKESDRNWGRKRKTTTRTFTWLYIIHKCKPLPVIYNSEYNIRISSCWQYYVNYLNTISHTSCGYVNVEANILETEDATATSLAPSLSIVVLPNIIASS